MVSFKEIGAQDTIHLYPFCLPEFGVDIRDVHQEEVNRLEFLAVDLEHGGCPDQCADGTNACRIIPFAQCFKAIFVFLGYIYQGASTTSVNQELARFPVDLQRGCHMPCAHLMQFYGVISVGQHGAVVEVGNRNGDTFAIMASTAKRYD